MASDAFSTIKKETIFLADFNCTIFSLNDVLMESIWLGNNGKMLSEHFLENFLASTSSRDEKHLIGTLVSKLDMTSPLISFLQSD